MWPRIFGRLIPQRTFLRISTSDLGCSIPEKNLLCVSTSDWPLQSDLWFRVFYPWIEPSLRIQLPDLFKFDHWFRVFYPWIEPSLRIHLPGLARRCPRIFGCFIPEKNLLCVSICLASSECNLGFSDLEMWPRISCIYPWKKLFAYIYLPGLFRMWPRIFWPRNVTSDFGCSVPEKNL